LPIGLKTARDQSEKIRQLSAQGLNKAQIAKQLNIGRASVFRALTQEPHGANGNGHEPTDLAHESPHPVMARTRFNPDKCH
jgi:hypothetical protein